MSPRSGWLLVNEILPGLRSAVPLVAHCVGAEDSEELIADATLHAARILESAESRGKTITPGNAAFYAIQHTKSGRRSTGNSCVDAMAAGTQLHDHSRMESMEQVVAEARESGGEIYLLHDVLASDQHDDVATQVARKMDWSEFASALTMRERAVIDCIVEGRSLRDAAKSFRVCDSTMQGDKRKLAVKIQDFMGVDILIEVRRSPRRTCSPSIRSASKLSTNPTERAGCIYVCLAFFISMENNEPKKTPSRTPHEFKVMRVRECAFPAQMVDTPERAVEYWKQNIINADWYDESKEALVVLVLNTRRRIIGHNLVTLGNLDSCSVQAREIFRPVIVAAGSACILVHNHPSKDSTPSEADIKVTRDLIRAGQLLKIEILDHVIVGETFHSLRQLGFFG